MSASTICAALEWLVELDDAASCVADRYTTDWAAAIAVARAALAEPVGEGPSERIVSIAKAVQECAFAHESDARLIGNVCAEDVADLCDAVIDRRARPVTPAAPEVASQPCKLPEPGEAGELVGRLGWIAAQLGDIGWSDDSASVARAATLLQQRATPAPVVVPVAVAERPWERDGWCDEQGRCWCGAAAFADNTGDLTANWPPSWELRTPQPQDDCVAPHHAIPLPQVAEPQPLKTDGPAVPESREPASVAAEAKPTPTPADRMALALCVAVLPGSKPCQAPCNACRVNSAAVAHELAAILRERYGSSVRADWLDGVGCYPGNAQTVQEVFHG